jgi:hypothetical protein
MLARERQQAERRGSPVVCLGTVNDSFGCVQN